MPRTRVGGSIGSAGSANAAFILADELGVRSGIIGKDPERGGTAA